MFWVSCLALALLATGAFAMHRQRWVRQVRGKTWRHLLADRAKGRVEATIPPALPEPVRRYFERMLPAHGRLPAVTRIRQHGTLRSSCSSTRWLDFTADQVIAARSTEFQWLARVAVGAGLSFDVCDRLVANEAGSEVRLCSLFVLGADRGSRELTEASLQRFLAEAIWSPAALLPAAGVSWQAIEERSALATLACGATRVSLQFRFNAEGEATDVYAPARWMRERGRYRAVAWEGRYFDYAWRDGIRVPLRAEVGWYVDEAWCPVWKGRIDRIEQLPA
ncbi:hypothetical protein SAMN05216289_14815 [Dokdonella immobilis]|uniref:Uncharacterized protein n=1 Tax=Dokdonella immobilis TaxID=578942 RepID=A0A1I5B1Z1_9GAMM|nr:hypothetical protein SAMN05216289_14815 [Dokdonella immobilis]